MIKPLRSGYTTGACAAAAAKGAAQMLATQSLVAEMNIDLPAGGSATFQLHGQSYTADEARCFVVKDAGDDPDITNGAELHALVRWEAPLSRNNPIVIEGGIGIGRVTKPGLAVPPGQWAINPVPLGMIEEAVRSVSMTADTPEITVVISIPDGEERARKTLNARLGIIGGLSILGTTGIVRPISAKAWTDTIDAALDVARACGCKNVVLSTGRSSEMAAQKHLPSFPEEAFIMMGDHVAYALQACISRDFMAPVIACQFAKMLKIACGYPNTHAAASELDLAVLSEWATTAHITPAVCAIISSANTAREIAVSTNFDGVLMKLVADRAGHSSAKHAPGITVRTLLCGYDGNVIEWNYQ